MKWYEILKDLGMKKTQHRWPCYPEVSGGTNEESF
jgi:hypothetical protein